MKKSTVYKKIDEFRKQIASNPTLLVRSVESAWHKNFIKKKTYEYLILF